MAKFSDFRVVPKKVLLERWIDPLFQVAYLIINWNVKEVVKGIEIEPGEKFHQLISKYLPLYVNESKMPPEDIAPAILNLADDFMAGKPMSLRAGDYIAIQNHIRKTK